MSDDALYRRLAFDYVCYPFASRREWRVETHNGLRASNEAAALALPSSTYEIPRRLDVQIFRGSDRRHRLDEALSFSHTDERHPTGHRHRFAPAPSLEMTRSETGSSTIQPIRSTSTIEAITRLLVETHLTENLTAIREVHHEEISNQTELTEEETEALRSTLIRPFARRTCCICQEIMKEGEEVVQLPCFESHTFHFDCLSEWFKTRRSCPLCRKRIVLHPRIP